MDESFLDVIGRLVGVGISKFDPDTPLPWFTSREHNFQRVILHSTHLIKLEIRCITGIHFIGVNKKISVDSLMI